MENLSKIFTKNIVIKNIYIENNEYYIIIKQILDQNFDYSLYNVSFSYIDWFSWNKLFLKTSEYKRLNKWYSSKKAYITDYISYNNLYQIEWYLDYWDGVNKWFIVWMILWIFSDIIGIKNGIIEGIVRFISWNWDSIWWFVSRILTKTKNTHESVDEYSYWTILWMCLWPIIQIISVFVLFTSPLMKAVYVSAYSNADNFMWSIFSLKFYIKKFWIAKGFNIFRKDPFQIANLSVIFLFLILNIITFYTFLWWFILQSMFLISIQSIILNTDSIIAVYVTNKVYQAMYCSILNKLAKNEL